MDGHGRAAPQQTFVSSGAAELAVFSWGSGGIPIAALHPGVADSRIWRWCAPTWVSAGYRVIAYDRRGFGASRYPEEVHDHLADLRAVTASTGGRPAFVIGNSRGGGLALDLALAHPAEVIGLVLVAPSVSGYPADDWPTTEAEEALDRLIAEAGEAGDLERVNQLEVRYWLDGTEEPEGRVPGPARDLLIEMNHRALASGPAGDTARHPPVWPRLEEIDVPTLVIAGEYDLPGIGRLCEELVRRLPAARLAVVEDTAHCPALDQPARLSRLVVDFLSSCDASPV